jgi:hypothetical protein
MDAADNQEVEERHFNVIPRIVLAPRISRLSNRFATVARR